MGVGVGLIAAGLLLGLWIAAEVAVRWWTARGLRTDFYGSISRSDVHERQVRHGVVPLSGPGWVHLGWIADPEREHYRVERCEDGTWKTVGRTPYGSFLMQGGGRFRVCAEPRRGGEARVLGEADVEPGRGDAPLFAPERAGPWRRLYRPSRWGDYVNDHVIYRDAAGRWRLLGITAKGDGDYSREKFFTAAVESGSGTRFPPSEMIEEEPVGDLGELAWAPHVLDSGGTYHLFWSPHRLHRMTSADGVHWRDHRIVIEAPQHRFFRDAMVLEVAPGQWLLYATGRGAYFSRVDVYQSFDLAGWQYIGAALRTAWGSERNALFASTESPTSIPFAGRYYLAVTYNNDSFVWTALLLPLKIWPWRRSYNNTLVFHSDNPYEFGVYRGRRRSPSLLTRIEAHAPELVRDGDQWWITTAGWPWVASLTEGEVAVAPLRWRRVSPGPRRNEESRTGDRELRTGQ